MRQLPSLADFIVSRREDVIAAWLVDVSSLPRRRDSDMPFTPDGGARVLDGIVDTLRSANATSGDANVPSRSGQGTLAAQRMHSLAERALLRRAILRLAGTEGLSFGARELLVLDDSIDASVSAPGEARIAAERSARLDAESARVRAREAEARSEAAAQRQRFLGDASRLLAESMDYQATLRTVARLAVPDIADWCVVDLIQDDGQMTRVAIEHRDPTRLALAHKLQESFPPKVGAAAGPAHVVHTRQTEFEPHVSKATLEEIAPEAERRGILGALGMNSYISVALDTRGRVLGTITFFTETGRALSPDDVVMAEDLARRAATAIDNAWLYDQAQRALRVRDDMLAIVTHDLRTPLSAIVTAAAIQIASASDDDVGRRVRQRAETVRRAADHMGRLVRDLTDIGQMDAGRFAINRSTQDVTALVREVVDTLQPGATQHGSELRAEIAGTIPPVGADGDRIVQVLSNLVTNAVKVGAPQVTVRVENRDNEVLFSVADKGPGIRNEDLPHMFDRYWRGKTAGYKGTGLGLPISKQIVTSHGGRIWIESQIGVGSTFFFTLPRCFQTEDTAHASGATPFPSSAHLPI
jgi:signal transduction histidine kinase